MKRSELKHNNSFLFGSWFQRKLDIRVEDLALKLSMSSVIGLSDLIEDEIIAKPLPTDIILTDVKIRLIEDRPSINITSPGPVPIEMRIVKMHIHRDDSGVFEIQPLDGGRRLRGEKIGPAKNERDKEIKTLQLVMQQLKIDNDGLKKQFQNAEKCFEMQS